MKALLSRWIVLLGLGGGLLANLALQPEAARSREPEETAPAREEGPRSPLPAAPEAGEGAREEVASHPSRPAVGTFGEELGAWSSRTEADLGAVREEIEALTRRILEAAMEGPAGRARRAVLQARLEERRERERRLVKRLDELKELAGKERGTR